jgi:hypothetical protein
VRLSLRFPILISYPLLLLLVLVAPAAAASFAALLGGILGDLFVLASCHRCSLGEVVLTFSASPTKWRPEGQLGGHHQATYLLASSCFDSRRSFLVHFAAAHCETLRSGNDSADGQSTAA